MTGVVPPESAARLSPASLRALAQLSLLAVLLMLTGGARAEEAAAPTFDVRAFRAEGNSVLADTAIEAVLEPYRGPARTFADLQSAVAALQGLYARKGFGAVTVVLPEQQLTSQTVRLQVIEAHLRQVAVEGPPSVVAAHIRRSLPSLRDGTTPNTETLAREIRLANENPSRHVSVELKSVSAEQIDAVVTVLEDRPWKLGGVFDNTGTPATGRTRVGAFLQHADVAGLDHVATLQYITSPDRPSDVTIAALSYRVPLPSLGDSIDLYGVYANVDSGIVGDLFSVRGSGTVAGVRYNQNLRPSASYQQRWFYSVEQRRTDNQVGLLGGAPDLVPDVTLHPASIGYAATWAGDARQLDLSASLVRNLPGGAHGGAADLDAARSGARARYTLVRYGANLLQPLPGHGVLRLAVDGQYTQDALVSAEQFGVGGQDSVRGFDERELISDIGSRATVELQTPDFGDRLSPGIATAALAFMDQGWLRRNHPLPGEVVQAHIASVGVGLRFAAAPSWHARVDASHVIKGTASRPRGDERLQFSVGYAY